MRHIKWSWKYSNELLIPVLFAFSFSLYSAESDIYADPPGAKSDFAPSSDVSIGIAKEADLFQGYTIKQLENSYKRAPEKVQLLVQQLLDDDFMSKPRFRGSFFTGKEGTGKTLIAFAVAYKVRKKFDCSVIHCPELIVKGHSMTELLNEKINQALKVKKGRENFGTLLIFEEGDQLFERAADPHFDTGATTHAVNIFFKENINNKKLFSILTVRECETFSEVIKERILSHGIIFTAPSKNEEKIDAFLYQLDIGDMQRDATCSNEFLQALFSTLPNYSGRYYEALVHHASFYAQKDQNDLDNIIISKDHVIAALADIQELQTILKSDRAGEMDIKYPADNKKMVESDDKKLSTKIYGAIVGGTMIVGGLYGNLKAFTPDNCTIM